MRQLLSRCLNALSAFSIPQEFITPIVKVTKGGEEKEFYSDVELSTWEATSPLGGWSYKYYKGTESTLALAME